MPTIHPPPPPKKNLVDITLYDQARYSVTHVKPQMNVQPSTEYIKNSKWMCRLNLHNLKH